MGAISVVLLGLSLPLARASVAANDAAIGIAGVAVMFVVNVAVLGVSNKSLGSNLLGLLDFSSPAAVCRWLRLARMTPSEAVGKHGPPGALLDHMPGEDDCPCSSCSGWLQNAGGSLSLLNTFVGTIFFAWLMLVLVVYTPLVTYGAELWATPYGGLLGVLYALTLVAVAVPTWLSHPLGIGNVAYTTLELRLHCRAASLAMGDLLGRFRAAVADGSEPPRSPCWLYVRLHYRFTAMCRSRRHQDSAFIARLYGLVIVPCVVVFAVLNTVG
ncbi:hypothetical protein DFJ74DRAFT_655727 [Hyaloraphidium curvatum]|nr:hypothetical protein DFJ74DRAFT_655727 [Hyaloraphidium curvatum]